MPQAETTNYFLLDSRQAITPLTGGAREFIESPNQYGWLGLSNNPVHRSFEG